MTVAIKIENLSKQYRLGQVSTRTLSHDLNRWWQTTIRGKEDPFLKIGEVNDRVTRGESEYVWALRDINLEVEQGEVLGIIGKNGAGKSTLLKILSKVTSPTTGTIKTKGRIASLLEVGTGFHYEMTGRENIFMNGAILGMTKAEIKSRFDEIVDFAGVERYIDTPVKRYSSGMLVRLGFAVAAHLEPEILIVDEVLAVGDADFQKKSIVKIQDISKGEGRTVLFVSHNLESIRNLCVHGALMKDGITEKTGEIDHVVNYYINKNIEAVGDCSEITDLQKHRGSFIVKEIEITKVRRLSNYDIDARDSLEFILELKKNENIGKIQIFGLIDNLENGGHRVGMAYSEPLDCSAEKESFRVLLRIDNHNLSKGKYIMDFWIGIGDINSEIKYYDAVYETLSFKIDKSNGMYINEWHHYWGQTCFNQVKAELI